MHIQIRQGDIFLLPAVNDVNIDQLKKISEGQYTLAYGETTGHSHVMKGDVTFYDNGNAQIVCNVKGQTELVHEEHDHINIPQDDYLVIYQREFDAIESTARRVMD